MHEPEYKIFKTQNNCEELLGINWPTGVSPKLCWIHPHEHSPSEYKFDDPTPSKELKNVRPVVHHLACIVIHLSAEHWWVNILYGITCRHISFAQLARADWYVYTYCTQAANTEQIEYYLQPTTYSLMDYWR